MENSVIAVQIANGAFVPVLDTSSRKRRRLVVTTVRDNQTSVKVELYRGADASMGEPEYVGSLLIANIEPCASGSPDVSVLLGIDEAGNLNATATDTRSGEYQSLSVNLDQLAGDGGYDIPDFELSDDELTIDEGSPDDEELEDLSFDDLDEEDEPVEPVTSSVRAGAEESFEPADGRSAALDDLADEEFPLDNSFTDELDEQFADGNVDAPQDAAYATLRGAEDTSFDAGPDDELVEADLGEEDFSFDDEIDDTLSPEEFDRMDAEPRSPGASMPPSDLEDLSDLEEEIKPRRSNAIVFVGYLILALAALGVLAYLVYRLLEGPPVPPLRVDLIGEISVALLLLSIPARRITSVLPRRRSSHDTRLTR